MRVATINGHELHRPTSGGKAGKGRNLSGSIQVRTDGQIVKQFRFNNETDYNGAIALRRAAEYAEHLQPQS